MTLEQMDEVIQRYCEITGELGENLCDGCQIKDLCDAIDGEFEKHPDILKKAWTILYDNYNKGCEECKFDDCTCEEYPCTKCKANIPHSDPEYVLAPCVWQPKTPEQPKVPKIETEPVKSFPTAVYHPTHYNQGDIECIDAMVSAFGKEAVATFCQINAFKYCWRSEHKNGLQDIEKAVWYLNKFKELKSSG